MIKKVTSAILVISVIFLKYTIICAEELKYAEIFDPKQDRVVKVVQLDAKAYDLIAKWIKNINSFYGKIDPATDDGYAVRIPLYPAVNVNNKWLKAYVNEVFIIIPENDPPFFMIFENKNKLTCFPFTGDIDELSRVLNFKLKRK